MAVALDRLHSYSAKVRLLHPRSLYFYYSTLVAICQALFFIFFYWVSLCLVPEFTHPRVLVHIYYSPNRATRRGDVFVGEVLHSQLAASVLRLPRSLISELIITYSTEFVNTFFVRKYATTYTKESNLTQGTKPNRTGPLSYIIIVS